MKREGETRSDNHADTEQNGCTGYEKECLIKRESCILHFTVCNLALPPFVSDEIKTV